MDEIYMDYNATTPIDTSVRQAIVSALDFWANPSSKYRTGQVAKAKIEVARVQIAQLLHNAKPGDIIFSSGGTEANNQVIHSVIRNFTESSRFGKETLPHIVTTNVEHDSISKVLLDLENKGFCECTFVPVDRKSGAVRSQDILQACKPQTCLVSVMLANNETGVIQPLKDIWMSLKFRTATTGRRVLVHSDAAQAFGKIPVDVKELGVDYLTIVGHKFYGPRIGALYVRDLEEKKTPLFPMFVGGGQEKGFRPGTENTPMIVGLGEAAKLCHQDLDSISAHLNTIRDYLEAQIQANFGNRVRVNFKHSPRLPNTSSLTFPDLACSAAEFLSRCPKVLASTGAACHSGLNKPSEVLLASGLNEHEAGRTIRFSVGKDTTKEEVDKVIRDLQAAYQTL